MDNALTGRRVLIVGASAGIGAALGQATLQAGASVTISARRQDNLDSLDDRVKGSPVALEQDARVVHERVELVTARVDGRRRRPPDGRP